MLCFSLPCKDEDWDCLSSLLTDPPRRNEVLYYLSSVFFSSIAFDKRKKKTDIFDADGLPVG